MNDDGRGWQASETTRPACMTARLEPATAPYPDKVQAAFDRMPRSWMPPFRLFTTLARHPELFERFIRGAPSYLPGTKLSIRQREVLLHRVTARCGCEYEWGMRVHYFAGEAGLTAPHRTALPRQYRRGCYLGRHRPIFVVARIQGARCDPERPDGSFAVAPRCRAAAHAGVQFYRRG